MADELPDKILFGIADGKTRAMVRLPDNTYADRVAPAVGGGLVTDSTGQVMFDIGSLPCKIGYDTDGNQNVITFGPDPKGRFVRQTSTWQSGRLVAESAWVMVAGMDAP